MIIIKSYLFFVLNKYLILTLILDITINLLIFNFLIYSSLVFLLVGKGFIIILKLYFFNIPFILDYDI